MKMMPVPNQEKWNTIATDFWTRGGSSQTVLELYGKHAIIQAPKLSGSLYWNYKKTYSIVLLALIDPCYNFIVVDVGSYGKNFDGGIFLNSNFRKTLQNGKLSTPE